MKEKRITQITEKDFQDIINNSVQNTRVRLVGNPAEVQKAYVKPIANVDGKPNVLALLQRLAREADEAVQEIPLVPNRPIYVNRTYEQIRQDIANGASNDEYWWNLDDTYYAFWYTDFNRAAVVGDKFGVTCSSLDGYIFNISAQVVKVNPEGAVYFKIVDKNPQGEDDFVLLHDPNDIPLVVDEVLTLPVSHKYIVPGYKNSIDLDSLSKLPKENDKFWGICKSTDDYVYSFVAKCTGNFATSNDTEFAQFEFTEVWLLNEGPIPFVCNVILEFRDKDYTYLSNKFKTGEELETNGAKSEWFSRPPKVGDTFFGVGNTSDKRIVGFTAIVTRVAVENGAEYLWFKFSDLVLLGEDYPILHRTMAFNGVTAEEFTATDTNGNYTFRGYNGHHSISTALFSIPPRVGNHFFGTTLLRKDATDPSPVVATFTAVVTGITNGKVDYSLVDATIIHNPAQIDEKVKASETKLNTRIEAVSEKIDKLEISEIVKELPEVGKPGKFYLVPKVSEDSSDLYDAWLWVNKGTAEEPDYGWEFEGTKTLHVSGGTERVILNYDEIEGMDPDEFIELCRRANLGEIEIAVKFGDEAYCTIDYVGYMSMNLSDGDMVIGVLALPSSVGSNSVSGEGFAGVIYGGLKSIEKFVDTSYTLQEPTADNVGKVIGITSRVINAGTENEETVYEYAPVDAQMKTDEGLKTTDKTIVGAINEVRSAANNKEIVSLPYSVLDQIIQEQDVEQIFELAVLLSGIGRNGLFLLFDYLSSEQDNGYIRNMLLDGCELSQSDNGMFALIVLKYYDKNVPYKRYITATINEENPDGIITVRDEVDGAGGTAESPIEINIDDFNDMSKEAFSELSDKIIAGQVKVFYEDEPISGNTGTFRGYFETEHLSVVRDYTTDKKLVILWQLLLNNHRYVVHILDEDSDKVTVSIEKKPVLPSNKSFDKGKVVAATGDGGYELIPTSTSPTEIKFSDIEKLTHAEFVALGDGVVVNVAVQALRSTPRERVTGTRCLLEPARDPQH